MTAHSLLAHNATHVKIMYFASLAGSYA